MYCTACTVSSSSTDCTMVVSKFKTLAPATFLLCFVFVKMSTPASQRKRARDDGEKLMKGQTSHEREGIREAQRLTNDKITSNVALIGDVHSTAFSDIRQENNEIEKKVFAASLF